MKRNHIMALLNFVVIAVLSLLVSGCASRQLIRTSLRPPPEASTDHHTIIAEQYISVTVADNYVKKYDAGGHYVIHPSDWEAIMDELDGLNADLDKKLEAHNPKPPE